MHIAFSGAGTKNTALAIMGSQVAHLVETGHDPRVVAAAQEYVAEQIQQVPDGQDVTFHVLVEITIGSTASENLQPPETDAQADAQASGEGAEA